MKSSVCVDANLIVHTLVPGLLTENALSLLGALEREYGVLIAPTLLAFEVTSTLRRLVFLKQLTPVEGEEAFESFFAMDIRLSHQRSIFPLAWQLARQFNLSRAYDTAYLALAQLRNCEFWTADRRLFNAVSGELDWVRWLGDYDVPLTTGAP